MKIVNLKDNFEQYFGEITEHFYNEWKDKYSKIHKCNNIDEVRDFYKDLYTKGGETHVCTNNEGGFIGCYTLMKHKGGKVFFCDFIVKPEYKQNGIEKVLAKHAIRQAKKYEPKAKYVHCYGYKKQIPMYIDLGYKVKSRSDIDVELFLLTRPHENHVPKSSFNVYLVVYSIICLFILCLLLWWIF